MKLHRQVRQYWQSAGLILGLFAGSARADMLLQDHFEYSNGNLGAAGIGDAVWPGGDTAQSGIAVSDTAALSYPLLGGATGSGVILSGTNNKKKVASFTTTTSGAVFCSMVVNIQAAPAATRLIAHVNRSTSSTSTPNLGIFVTAAGEIGIGRAASAPAFTSTALEAGSHLIVVAYTFIPDTGNDRVDLWIDPTNNLAEAVPPAATGSVTTGGTDTTTGLQAFFFINPTTGGGTIWADELRITTSWAEATGAGSAPPTLPTGPHFTDITVTGGPAQLTYTGTLGNGYSLWASPNPAATPVSSTWTLLTNDVFSGGLDQFTDTEAPNYSGRFYIITVP